MAIGPGQRDTTHIGTASEIDQGLRSHMLKVYNYMTLGLGLTGLVAFFVLNSPALQAFVYSPMIWVLMIVELGMVFYLAARIHKLKLSTAQALFLVYAALNGLTIGAIVMQFTGVSVARVFFITAGVFAAMSLYGYTTKRDLSGLGSFLFAGLIGLVIASIVNIFLGWDGLAFAISVLGVGIFVGLTAYDTQQIKETYYMGDSQATAGKKAVLGALRLYLDFINMFIFLLQLLGNRE